MINHFKVKTFLLNNQTDWYLKLHVWFIEVAQELAEELNIFWSLVRQRFLIWLPLILLFGKLDRFVLQACERELFADCERLARVINSSDEELAWFVRSVCGLWQGSFVCDTDDLGATLIRDRHLKLLHH